QNHAPCQIQSAFTHKTGVGAIQENGKKAEIGGAQKRLGSGYFHSWTFMAASESQSSQTSTSILAGWIRSGVLRQYGAGRGDGRRGRRQSAGSDWLGRILLGEMEGNLQGDIVG